MYCLRSTIRPGYGLPRELSSLYKQAMAGSSIFPSVSGKRRKNNWKFQVI